MAPQILPASSSVAPRRVAIVGCGAVVEHFHLPASKFVPQLSIEVLVDRDERRAAALAAAHGVPRVSQDYRSIVGQVDAAIVALPHTSNARVAGELLGERISVLVEKPMAISAAEAQEVLSASEAWGASLRVGYTRRCGYGVDFARQALRKNLLGTITGFSVEDGYPFNWKSAAREFRLRKGPGGGLLMDIGCHVFDMLIYWFGPLVVLSSFNDDMGGVEVNAFVSLQTQSGILGTAELSWERVLRNSAIIKGTAGCLEIEWYRNNAAAYFSGSTLRGTVAPDGSDTLLQTFEMMFVEQLRQWANVLDGCSEACSLASGREALEVLKLVEHCRQLGGVLQLPWMPVQSNESRR